MGQKKQSLVRCINHDFARTSIKFHSCMEQSHFCTVQFCFCIAHSCFWTAWFGFHIAQFCFPFAHCVFALANLSFTCSIPDKVAAKHDMSYPSHSANIIIIVSSVILRRGHQIRLEYANDKWSVSVICPEIAAHAQCSPFHVLPRSRTSGSAVLHCHARIIWHIAP